ncbi:MAG: hypothetical protein WAP20_07665 [Limnochordia bacterium]|nr:hypothetical protein [Bacillota bacterium]HOB09402.1 hypothetical protein [Limnochordia bacterium]NLH31483.1 hypothetical protein [Bacillota bacterium]HPT93521.1 hypothetical protein [Limnochordia bacterium]HPZ31355.1 hypothetical protein [Limnochordia bacterium]
MRIGVAALALFILIGITAQTGSAQGALLPVNPEQPYRQGLRLDPNTSYRMALDLKASEANAIIALTVELYDRGGEQIGKSQVQRGLGVPNHWYSLGIEFYVPENAAEAFLILSVDREAVYWWDALRLTKIDTSLSAIRQFWEERINTYGQVYTGLVVDARGLGLGRGMSPRIWSESGQLIYGGISATYDFLQHVGLASYGSELTPELLQRISVDPEFPLAVPLVVKAVRVVEPARTSVVISNEAAEQILKALAAYDFLARFAVIFLID